MYIKYTVLERMYFPPLGSELNERVYIFKWDNNARRRTLKPAFLSPSGRRGSSTFPPVVGDWLQRHARMERDPPPPTGSQKAICSARAIVWRCIDLFYVPHWIYCPSAASGAAGGGECFTSTAPRTKGGVLCVKRGSALRCEEKRERDRLNFNSILY